MTDADFHRLKHDVVQFMIEQMKQKISENKQQEMESEEKMSSVKVGVSGARGLLDGLEDSDEDDDTSAASGSESIKDDCNAELERYLVEKSLKLEKSRDDKKVVYNDPLIWWKQHENKYPTIAPLAAIVLAIPATSAPSERVWSQSALVMNVKRARMDEDISSAIIFVKHNLPVLRKHYNVVSKGVKGALPSKFCGLPECLDGVLSNDSVVDMDVGQDMFHMYKHNLN